MFEISRWKKKNYERKMIWKDLGKKNYERIFICTFISLNYFFIFIFIIINLFITYYCFILFFSSFLFRFVFLFCLSFSYFLFLYIFIFIYIFFLSRLFIINRLNQYIWLIISTSLTKKKGKTKENVIISFLLLWCLCWQITKQLWKKKKKMLLFWKNKIFPNNTKVRERLAKI